MSPLEPMLPLTLDVAVAPGCITWPFPALSVTVSSTYCRYIHLVKTNGIYSMGFSKPLFLLENITFKQFEIMV